MNYPGRLHKSSDPNNFTSLEAYVEECLPLKPVGSVLLNLHKNIRIFSNDCIGRFV